MNTKLSVAQGLQLPTDLVTQVEVIIAKRRAGKSYTMRRIVEQLLMAAQQIVLVDPKGDQWGIRSSADGKKPGYPVLIVGGEHGDLPLEANGGEVVARLVVEERVNVLIDLSQFRKHEIATFMTAFLETLYRLKAQERYRTPVKLIVDEADAIGPQKPQRGEERMLGAIEDIVRRGGQRGIGCTLVTQRSAVLNKNLLTQAQMLVVLRTIAPHDLAAIKAWIDVHGTAEEGRTLMESLPSLPIGDAWFWSPGWPTDEGIFKRVHVLPIKTFDSGATPKPGQRRIIPKNLADVDLDALKGQMAATIEKAKQDDPKLLRKRIAELELKTAPAHSPAVQEKIIEKRVEVPILTDSQITRLEKLAERMFAEAQRHGGFMALLWGNFNEIAEGLGNGLEAIAAFQKGTKRNEVQPLPAVRAALTKQQAQSSPAPRLSAPDVQDGTVTGPEQQILNGIRWMERAGTTSPEQTIVATLAGYSIYSSSFIKALSSLRSKGFVGSQGKKIWLTQEGSIKAQEPERTPSTEELHQRLLDKLDGPSAKVMRPLIAAQGAEVNDDDLAAASGYSPLSSSYIKAKSVLRGKDLMESSGKMHAARNILFL